MQNLSNEIRSLSHVRGRSLQGKHTVYFLLCSAVHICGSTSSMKEGGGAIKVGHEYSSGRCLQYAECHDKDACGGSSYFVAVATCILQHQRGGRFFM